MMQFSVKILDDDDRELVEVLRSTGMARNVASVISFLANVKEANSREIEIGSNLRQPEVSTAMRILRSEGWISEKEIKKEGKGRPTKSYALAVTLEEIVSHVEEQKRKELAKTMDSIRRLRALDLVGKSAQGV